MNDMDVYRETRIEGRRRFELTAEGVRVQVDYALGPSMDTLIRYDQLDPRITVIRMRHSLFGWSMMGIPLFAVATAITFQSPIFGISFCGLMVSSVVAVLTRQRIEYARFCTPALLAALDIARSGPDCGRFEQFVATVQDRINAARTEVACS